jgi:hypothetical protein
MSLPDEQAAPYPNKAHPLEPPRAAAVARQQKRARGRPRVHDGWSTPHRRQGDRGSSDDDGAAAAPALLPVFVRYTDLVAAGLVRNWTQLERLVDHYGFPEGTLLSPNTRAFDLRLVEDWIRSRPTARRKTPRREKASEETV